LQRLVANAQKNYNQGHNENCSVWQGIGNPITIMKPMEISGMKF
jgi:hypothetical protein